MRRIDDIAAQNFQLVSLMRRVRRVAFCLALCISCLVPDTTAIAQLRNRAGSIGDDPHPFPQCRVRPQDQVWLVSTRHLPFEGNGCNCLGGRAPNLEYSRYDGCGNWTNSSAESFFDSQDPRLVTTVYVHGNRVSSDWAKDHGFTVYCRLTQCACDSRPIRHVIWSWPSDPIPCGARVIKDAKVKSCRTTSQSYYLGWWLAQMSSEQRVSLMGFSYGGRAILNALQLVNGGALAGCSLPGSAANRVRPRVAIWGSASEANWLCRGGSHEGALAQMDRGLIIYNPNDPALKRYQRVVPGARGPALGSIGVPNCVCANGKLWQINAGQMIGKIHRFKPYMDVNCLVSKIREYALWPDRQCVACFARDTVRMPGFQQLPAAPRAAASEVSEVSVGDLPTFDLTAEYRRERLNLELIDDAESVDVGTLPNFRVSEVTDAETATVNTELR